MNFFISERMFTFAHLEIKNTSVMNSDSQPKASLIISVYNNIPFLEAVLDSVNHQTWNDFEIIVSEDGEHEDMRTFLNRFPFRHPWQHLHQEDDGWRKNKALNKAIQASHSDYLVFVDGDCVLHPRFMEMHHRMAKEGSILGGKRLKLNGALSKEFMEGKRTHRNIGLFLLKNLFRLHQMNIRFPEEAFFLSPTGITGLIVHMRKIKELRGCNMSFYKKDILLINGFDEDYIKPAIGEDADLTWRFRMAGFKLRSMRNLAVQYHLHHRENWNEQEDNAQMMARKKEKGLFYCLNGIKFKS
jgi:glycosyltransferase involved in cell wall biosynthesis